MKAHRVEVTVTESHEVVVRLPGDFPVGTAEVIVRAMEGPNGRRVGSGEADPGEDAFARRFPRAGRMGPVVFHEEATAPVDAEDWPESMR